MNRLVVFESALAAALSIEPLYDWSAPLKSAIAQLRYLIDLETGKTTDRSRLADINIGVIAAREIEDMDQGVAEAIHFASAEARKMAAGG